jgi:hypothetical protein
LKLTCKVKFKLLKRMEGPAKFTKFKFKKLDTKEEVQDSGEI